MKDHFQTEDTLNNKEVGGSPAENLKCLYLSIGYSAPHSGLSQVVVESEADINIVSIISNLNLNFDCYKVSSNILAE